jgi:hypothetical protein
VTLIHVTDGDAEALARGAPSGLLGRDRVALFVAAPGEPTS